MSKHDLLSVSLDSTGEKLVIEIGTDVLLHGLMSQPAWPRDVVITDRDAFLVSFMEHLKKEDENGTTYIYEAFDEAAIQVIEWADPGVDDYVEGGPTVEDTLTMLRKEIWGDPTGNIVKHA